MSLAQKKCLAQLFMQNLIVRMELRDLEQGGLTRADLVAFLEDMKRATIRLLVSIAIHKALVDLKVGQ